jgi:cell division protein FtsI/penicillin-binding protein 2
VTEFDFSKKRFNFVVGVLGTFFLVLLSRLFLLQVINHSKYSDLAQNQYIDKETLITPRGKIYASDYFGSDIFVPIATNKTVYSLLVVPKNVSDAEETSRKLAPYINLSQSEIYQKINNDKLYIPPLQNKIDKDTANDIRKLELSGVLLIPVIERYYPEQSLASHVLGYVDAEGNGQYGIEDYYDNELKGLPKTIFATRDTIGRYIDIVRQEQSTATKDIYLTIDRSVQYYVETRLKKAVEELNAQSGSVVVMDPNTGAIIAMANYPTFDPNRYSKTKSISLFNNLSINALYEPGSIFKPFVVAAALEEDRVEPETSGVFGKSVQIGSYTISTSTGRAYGRETIGQILEHSDNVGMVYIGKELGEKNLDKYLNKFGFRDKTGIDLISETKSDVLDFSDWREINAATMTFGQGIALTPLQLVTAIASVANGGTLYQPYTVDKIVSDGTVVTQTKPKSIRQTISLNTAQQLTTMLVGVVNRGFGSTAGVQGYDIAGKTGTAQIPNPKGRGYLEDKNIVSFLGYAPAKEPKFAMIVKLDSPSGLPWAESTAAPVFGDIASWLLSYMQIAPTK